MEFPLVSIITPAFNCKETILETYNSVRKQTLNSWEWIVVDDCSQDESFDLLMDLCKRDNRVILLRTQKNSGAAISRNQGIEKARGRFIAFLDADDLWKEEKLERQISFMEEHGYAFSFTNYDLLYPNGTIKTYKTKLSSIGYEELLKTNQVGCLTAIYDSTLLGKVFMPLDCEKREDHGAWLDITRNGTKAYRLDESLAVYRIGAQSVSAKKTRMIKYQYRLYRRHEKFGVFKSLWYLFLCSTYKLFLKY